jgi:hypothetical protein
VIIDGKARGWTPASGIDVNNATEGLVAGLSHEPWGQASPSIYETGRLVALAPWLTRHAERVTFLLASQRTDGGWGGPEGYALVPTLSATEALLATHRAAYSGTQQSVRAENLTSATDRGLRALSGWLRTSMFAIPDTPAVDLIVPALVARINEHLDQLRDAPLTGLDGWRGDRRLGLPAGMTSARLVAIQRLLASGAPVPEKLLHALEIVGDMARGVAGVRPLAPGTIGASPAATAAWLGEPAGWHGEPGTAGSADDARAYLESVSRQQGGPVPCATPITVFERAWVLSGLARAGIPLTVPPDLIRSLTADLGEAGTPAGPGLPADADTTSVTLHALSRLGAPVAPDSLWAFETEDGFCTWPGEDGFSVTTNAHVLDAFGHHLVNRRDPAPRYLAAVDRLSAALRDRQQADGGWLDRWHASPYYATACCVLALDQFGRGESTTDAVARAIDWVVATQRRDGAWGRWEGTAEETGYALQMLLATRTTRFGIGAAVSRGYAYLREVVGQHDDPPLWHDKDLYRPTAIVRTAVLAALHLGQRRPDLLASTKTPTA